VLLGAIRLDGVPVEVGYEAPFKVSVVKDRALAIGILGFCAARFPTLGALRPTRPADAYDCSLWGGTGRSENASDGICLCGGLGWMVPATGGV